MLPQSNIQATLFAIGERYQGDERSWLQAKNPGVLRQLDAMADKIDAAVLAGDDVAQLCKAWAQAWLFWIKARNNAKENKQ